MSTIEEQIQKLSKAELITLLTERGFFCTDRDIRMARYFTLYRRAEKAAGEALADVKKFQKRDSATARLEWFKAHARCDKAFKMYARADKLWNVHEAITGNPKMKGENDGVGSM